MQNPGQLLSSDPIRHALQAAKHVSMHEMGDAVEAYVLLYYHRISNSRKISWSYSI